MGEVFVVVDLNPYFFVHFFIYRNCYVITLLLHNLLSSLVFILSACFFLSIDIRVSFFGVIRIHIVKYGRIKRTIMN